MSTLSEIAESVGISRSTVFRVINRQPSPSVPEEVRQKILAMAAESQYHARTRRRAVGMSKARKIAVIGLSSSSLEAETPFFQQLTREIQRECDVRGFSSNNVDYVWSGDVRSYSQFEHYDKVIVLGRNVEAEEYFHPRDTQVLVVAGTPDPNRFPLITVDLVRGTQLAVNHLLALGYDPIGYFGEQNEESDPASRFAAFESLLLKRKQYDARYVDLNGDWSAASGFAMATAAVKSGRLARAYFAANDSMALGAMSALTTAGLRVPEDVAIVGFDNIDLARYASPSLTTVDDQVELCAHLAVSMVADGLAGELPLVKMLVPTTLVIRDSCGYRLTKPLDSESSSPDPQS